MSPADPITSAEEIKSCCAAAYSSDFVALILGESYHPGGLALTRRLADGLGLRPGMRVLDVASGRGATARLLASEYGVRVDGIDLSAENVAAAQREAPRSVIFQVADAEGLPFPDARFDAIVCECAFCTFPGKEAAAREFARVLKPGGRLGITDITIDGPLPPSLDTLTGWVACLADARPAETYVKLLTGAGFGLRTLERHDEALQEMISQIRGRLRLLRMASTTLDVDRALEIAGEAAKAAENGLAGYCLVILGWPEE